MVGRTYAHPKADASATPARSAPASVAGRMFLAVVCGAFFGLVLSVVIAPGFAFALAVGGAMSFGAGAVALFLFEPSAGHPQQNARTEEEVRQTLADIKARQK